MIVLGSGKISIGLNRKGAPADSSKAVGNVHGKDVQLSTGGRRGPLFASGRLTFEGIIMGHCGDQLLGIKGKLKRPPKGERGENIDTRGNRRKM